MMKYWSYSLPWRDGAACKREDNEIRYKFDSWPGSTALIAEGTTRNVKPLHGTIHTYTYAYAYAYAYTYTYTYTYTYAYAYTQLITY